MEIGIHFFIIVLFVYLGIVLGAFLLQEYFLFHPEKLHSSFKFKYPIPFEEVVIPGDKNSIIDALHFKVDGATKVVFYFKGNTRSIKGWGKFAIDFTSKGYNFFMIDYPGFGKSTGKRNEELIYKNAQIAYDHLKKYYPEDDIIIYGRSLGAAFATCIAANNNPSMLILDSPYVSMHRLAQYYTRILPLKYILKYKMPLYDFACKTTIPIHILHGDRDWIIPYRFSLELLSIDPARINLYTINGGSHNNLPKFEQYHLFLKEILHTSIQKKQDKK